MGASYNRRRYASDPEFRRAAIASSQRYQTQLAVEEPERAAEVRRRKAIQARERYHTDPVYREACLAAQRKCRGKASAAASTDTMIPIRSVDGNAAIDF